MIHLQEIEITTPLIGGAGNDTFLIIDVNNGNDVIEGDTMLAKYRITRYD
jgi:hypothetical protein